MSRGPGPESRELDVKDGPVTGAEALVPAETARRTDAVTGRSATRVRAPAARTGAETPAVLSGPDHVRAPVNRRRQCSDGGPEIGRSSPDVSPP